jgi:hypothetical protein
MSIDVAVQVRRTFPWDERINPPGTIIVMTLDEACLYTGAGFVRVTDQNPRNVPPLFLQHERLRGIT